MVNASKKKTLWWGVGWGQIWPKKSRNREKSEKGTRADVGVTSIIEEEASASTGGADVAALL